MPEEAIALAAELLLEATRGQRLGEKLQARQMAAMMDDAPGKAFTFAMADQVFRPPTAAREAKRFRDLVEDYGVPQYLPLVARVAMRAGEIASAAAPEIVMPLVAEKMRQESSSVILPAEEAKLRKHLRRRRDAGMRMNLNQLGEAVLGEEEANHRLEANLTRLADPDTDYISVKISAIFSQIHLVAVDETLIEIKRRLRELYRAAMKSSPAKFVNLDMEEYRDLRLTCAAFRDVLDEPEFQKLEAGIVLQAYLPDAWPVQKELNIWALKRVDAGGASIKIRIVKGANLAMEKVDAEIHDWPLAPYGSKVEVDANFKRMLHEGCRKEVARAVRLGVASHNLFDIAYGLLLRAREGVEDRVEFEMLEGMANHQARTVRDAAKGLLLYAPVVNREDFHSAIAYLVRRLDENTSPENFLHDLFGMKPGDAAWDRQKKRFLDACAMVPTAIYGPQRVQDRTTENRVPLPLDTPFHNEADTDWSLPHNVRWAREKVDAMRKAEPPFVPLQIGGMTSSGTATADGTDPARPGHVAYRHALGGPEDIERALEVAVSARSPWRNLGWPNRAIILAKVASVIASRRGEAIATMVMDAGKAVMEADAELSEAIDFADYYARSFSRQGAFDGVNSEPIGTVLVTPPWNFPYAIPCGGILAALAAGNTVILKPAPETVLTAWEMVSCLWDAGVPRDVLQFLPCPDNHIGRSLVTDERIGAVVLTGAYETARMFLSWKPDLRLFAETSGKNALVITASADPDLAVKDLVKSAFGHAGQKCSAASLAIVEAELYDDEGFRRRLRDAAASLKAGVSWEYDSVVTTIIREPGEALQRALTTLDPGEEWLLEPQMLDGNPCLWSPGIKLGVTPDSWFRSTECFGPVLGLVRANDIDHAIRIQNDSEFGLTGGIHALDPAEIDAWRDQAEVGNAYINRPITGAIVQRQPFGGWKRSCFGPGAKAGGPNYVPLFAVWQNDGLPQLLESPSAEVLDLLKTLAPVASSAELEAAAGSDAWWMKHEFGIEHDPSALACEANVFRYRRFSQCLIRANASMDAVTIARLLIAARAAGLDSELSLPPGTDFPVKGISITHETDEALASRLGASKYGVLRAPSPSKKLIAAAIEAGVRIVTHDPVWSGKLELPAFFREQAVSETRHRHGSVLPRPEELR
ncbi:bifunctional proline dehydrogenase/L-glutamate gamma-semialdehyde dehydrogenase [Luteolibacter flavescens]|uniref:L-glutamate gamma-semialdehyde dehydrogenase n=1 Tax=Luteolibacter flavescens TaxID=1859460 RepID=A0ABT3FJF7_9BACT|nr:bifunctional proline dehydrogenase/L-glutamate gamma-semialdehyde dehydrogenase [Luteolibacter flavescens]MCW1883416.1 bifunctional proline dehydrogenase/L-glutamate gamma-semialdehyde dehydrogenase [Luteolibacter flavescens]